MKQKGYCWTNHQLMIQNSRLLKQNQILTEQLNEKQTIIDTLKLELDETIIEDTKSKLYCLRLIQTEVYEQTKQLRQKCHYQLKSITKQMQQQRILAKEQNEIMMKLKFQLEEEQLRRKNIQEQLQNFKKYIIEIVAQKDYIIQELTGLLEGVSSLQAQEPQLSKKNKTVTIRRNY